MRQTASDRRLDDFIILTLRNQFWAIYGCKLLFRKVRLGPPRIRARLPDGAGGHRRQAARPAVSLGPHHGKDQGEEPGRPGGEPDRGMVRPGPGTTRPPSSQKAAETSAKLPIVS